MTHDQLFRHIIDDAEQILNVREEDGQVAAMALWQKLDEETAPFRDIVPSPILDLLIQIEFLLEGDPTGDIGEARRSLYVANASLSKTEER